VSLKTTSVLFTDLFVAISLVAIVGFTIMLFKPGWRDGFARRCVGPATAVDLAWVRIVACAVTIIYVLVENLPSMALLDPSWYAPPGYIDWIGRARFDAFMSSELALELITWATLLALVLAMFGVLTRVSLPAATLLYLLFGGLLRSFGKWFHEGYLCFYVLTVLCFLPCADAWSVDERWLRGWWKRLWRSPDVPAASETAYAWGVYACYVAACIPYLQLGLSKLANGGLYWFDGRSMRNYMVSDCLNLTELQIDLPLRFMYLPVWMYTLAGLFGLLTEVLYPTVLVWPRLRRVLPLCAAMLHVGICITQDQWFVDATLIPFIFFVPSLWLGFVKRVRA
jgi:hypothetical protein